MTGKNRFSVPAGALFLYILRIVLIIAAPIAVASASHAVADPGFPESTVQMDTFPSENTDYCKPAEISLRDRSIRAGLLYDLAADAVVWEKNMDQAFPIASLTKMMVALIAVEDIVEGKVSLDTDVKVTAEAAKMRGSKVHLRTGCVLSVEELLKAAMISSGNDAAYLLAQFLGGTESAFVERMNQRALQLGMKDTVFSNSTGMPAPDSRDDNRSSPADLLLLSKEMLKYKDLLEISGMSNAVITQNQRKIKLTNHNGLVSVYDNVDGFKTGFTLNAKYCLVATANKSDRRLISIVLGASSRSARNQFTATAFSRYYEALGIGRLDLKTNFDLARGVKKGSASETLIASGSADTKYYKVKRGDSLYSIAKRHRCKVAELQAWNQIRGNRIDPGQKLVIRPAIPGKENGDFSSGKNVRLADNAAAEKNTGSPIVYLYTVRRGDTLWQIAKKFDGVTVKDIMKTNRIKRAKTLKPGTTLKIVMAT